MDMELVVAKSVIDYLCEAHKTRSLQEHQRQQAHNA